MKPSTQLLLVASAFILSALAYGQESDTPKRIVGPGVTHSHEFIPEGPYNYNVMRVEIDNPHVTLETESGKDRLFAGEPVLSSAKREAEPGKTEIIGGVNADFWSNKPRMFWPVGLLVADGMIYNMPSRSRSAFALTKDEKPYIGTVSLQVELADRDSTFRINRINSGTDGDSVVLFTPPYGDEVQPAQGKRYLLKPQGNGEFLPNQPLRVAIEEVDSRTTTPLSMDAFILHSPEGKTTNNFLKDGKVLTLRATMPEVQGVVASVCGGGPAIVKNGRVSIDLENEKVAKSFSETKHPRTALGYSKDRQTVYLVTVDGRQPRVSIGASLDELADYMVKLGCWEAINLDGGGSTTMVVGDKVVNKPSDFRGPRTVANSLLVVASDSAGQASTLSFDPDGKPLLVPVGSRITIAVSALDENSVPTELPKSDSISVAASPLIANTMVKGSAVTLVFSDKVQYGDIKITAGDAEGILPVRTVALDKIVSEPGVVVLGAGDDQELHVTAMTDGKQLPLSDGMVSFSSLDPSIVRVDASTATGVRKGKTAIEVRIGTFAAQIPAYVDMAKRVSLEDFDSVDDLGPFEGTAFNKSGTRLVLETENRKEGKAAALLNYEMSRGGRTRINLPLGIKLTEEPATFAIWLYGDGKEAWLRANLVDSNGTLFIADFTNGADGITWNKEWKRLAVSYQSLIGTDFTKSPRPKLPIIVNELVIAQDQEALKTSGSIIIDAFDALYPPEQ